MQQLTARQTRPREAFAFPCVHLRLKSSSRFSGQNKKLHIATNWPRCFAYLKKWLFLQPNNMIRVIMDKHLNILRFSLIVALLTLVPVKTWAGGNSVIEVNKLFFEGGDTLSITIPNDILDENPTDLRIDIIDTETAELLLSYPFSASSRYCTDVNILLPTSGIRCHDDVVKFFSPLRKAGPKLYVNGDKSVIAFTDWPVAENLKYSAMLTLESIPFERITYINLEPRVYHAQLAKQPKDDVYFLSIATDLTHKINNDFAVKIMSGDNILAETQIKIHKIDFRPYWVNGKMRKAANKNLLRQNNDEMFYWE